MKLSGLCVKSISLRGGFSYNPRMSDSIAIRPFQGADRSGVRRIACDTADAGEPMENFFSDRELLADLLTRYYTDFDSRSTFVAVEGAAVAGYLTGCLDTRRFHRRMALKIFPLALAKAVARGVLFRSDTWRLIQAGLATWRAGASHRRIYFERYPAHLHINIDEAYRGQKIGHRLIEKFLDQAKAAGVPGIHLATRGDNTSGRAFFERVGFQLMDTEPAFFPSSTGLIKQDVCVYARSL